MVEGSREKANEDSLAELCLNRLRLTLDEHKGTPAQKSQLFEEGMLNAATPRSIELSIFLLRQVFQDKRTLLTVVFLHIAYDLLLVYFAFWVRDRHLTHEKVTRILIFRLAFVGHVEVCTNLISSTLIHNVAVGQKNQPIGACVSLRARLVNRAHNRLASFCGETLQDPADLDRCLTIKATSRLIKQDHLRISDQLNTDGSALALATRDFLLQNRADNCIFTLIEA